MGWITNAWPLPTRGDFPHESHSVTRQTASDVPGVSTGERREDEDGPAGRAAAFCGPLYWIPCSKWTLTSDAEKESERQLERVVLHCLQQDAVTLLKQQQNKQTKTSSQPVFYDVSLSPGKEFLIYTWYVLLT